MQIKTLQEFDNFAQQFQNCTLAKKEWTHKAHLAIGLWLIQRHDLEKASMYARDSIKKYNETIGVLNNEHSGYHESITMLYLRLIDHFVKQVGANNEIELLAGLLDSEIVDKNYPLKFYSAKKLFSQEARLQWVEPDLQPLPIITRGI